MKRTKGFTKLKRPRKLKKKLPPTEAQKAHIRDTNRRRKQEQRGRQRDTSQERYLMERLGCCDLDWIKRFVALDPDRPGCWVWRGPWIATHARAVPLVRRGEAGKMHAAKAVWMALERPGLVRQNYLAASCGHDDCVSPDHLVLKNNTLERARKIMARSEST